MMACIVVFCTTYALLLPAVTLEKTAECGLEEHQHEEGCYEEQLVCGQEESGEHRHTDICYQKVLVCGKEVHIHSADCFQKKALDGAGDGTFGMYDTAEEAGMPPLEEVENVGDTAVNEPAADSALDLEAFDLEALDLEAEDESQIIDETAGAGATLSAEVSEELPEEAFGEAALSSEQPSEGETFGEAMTSDQPAEEEAAGEASTLWDQPVEE